MIAQYPSRLFRHGCNCLALRQSVRVNHDAAFDGSVEI